VITKRWACLGAVAPAAPARAQGHGTGAPGGGRRRGGPHDEGVSTYNLDLSPREAKDLKTALSIRLVGMREELVHTDDRAYRADLRATLDRLEVVLQRLEAVMGSAAKAP
jgi:hypothetical protein